MNTNLLAFVLERLDQRSPSWVIVARETGVPYSTLKKIASRVTPNPGVVHVQALADFFSGLSAGSNVKSEGPANTATPEA